MSNPKYPPIVHVRIEQRKSGAWFATSPQVPGFEAVAPDRNTLESEMIEKYLFDLYKAAGKPEPAWHVLEFEPAGKCEWIIVFNVIPTGKQFQDEEEKTVTVWADTSIEALIEAARSLRSALEVGDLIHDVHVSPPRKTRPKELE